MKTSIAVYPIEMESMLLLDFSIFRSPGTKQEADFALLSCKHSDMQSEATTFFVSLALTVEWSWYKHPSLCVPFFSTCMEREMTVSFLSASQREEWTFVSHFSLRTNISSRQLNELVSF